MLPWLRMFSMLLNSLHPRCALSIPPDHYPNDTCFLCEWNSQIAQTELRYSDLLQQAENRGARFSDDLHHEYSLDKGVA